MNIYSVTSIVELDADAPKTAVRFLTSSNRKATLKRLNAIDLSATPEDEGVACRVMIGGSGGEATTSTPYPNLDKPASLGTAEVNYSEEPTGAEEAEVLGIPPGGGIDHYWNTDLGEGITASNGSAIGIELTAATARRVSVKATFEE